MKFNTILLLLSVLAIAICYSHQENQFIKYRFYSQGKSCNDNTNIESVSFDKTNVCVPTSDPVNYGYEIAHCTQISSDKVRVIYKTSCNTNCSHCLTNADNVISTNECQATAPYHPYRVECGAFNIGDYPPMLWTIKHSVINGKSDCKDDSVKSISGTPLNTCISVGSESFTVSCNGTWAEKRIWENNSCKNSFEYDDREKLEECLKGKFTFCGKK
ncbi:predicted protein [Naegleria gruberi]|uniref:Predicted protein n=1 Tax=Naegleria gruberi TaxID=5762 RepID=D2V6V6_NAEGR|nr:uncharacterized protein NAEGRDRAFT_47137 [Naegleria gruberi]EFC47639.1 predicted protein [Naegleria gruberi]|eukprot:XP_002680383.1 predicted protein [Naegleria gruberi strain NEG-M]